MSLQLAGYRLASSKYWKFTVLGDSVLMSGYSLLVTAPKELINEVYQGVNTPWLQIRGTQWAEKVIGKKFWHIFDKTRAIMLVDHSILKSTQGLYKKSICYRVSSVLFIKKPKNHQRQLCPAAQSERPRSAKEMISLFSI